MFSTFAGGQRDGARSRVAFCKQEVTTYDLQGLSGGCSWLFFAGVGRMLACICLIWFSLRAQSAYPEVTRTFSETSARTSHNLPPCWHREEWKTDQKPTSKSNYENNYYPLSKHSMLSTHRTLDLRTCPYIIVYIYIVYAVWPGESDFAVKKSQILHPHHEMRDLYTRGNPS